jgi:hypothetical protein
MREFTTIINDTPQRNNKHAWRKAKHWSKVKDDCIKEIRQSLGLTPAEARQIRITRRECNLETGWSKVMGVVSDSVGAKIHGKTI